MIRIHEQLQLKVDKLTPQTNSEKAMPINKTWEELEKMVFETPKPNIIKRNCGCRK